MYPLQVSLLLCLVSAALAAPYSLSDNWVGSAFLNTWTWQNIVDPTNGRVNYVDQATALAGNLTYVSDDAFIIRADYTTVLSPSDPGRNSVRISSNSAYTTHVVVFDIQHMPQGCGTWPAAWETLGSDWPYSGEVDIVEGVNDQSPNLSSLHTSPGCAMPGGSAQLGSFTNQDCNTADNYNQGCGVRAPSANSYGPSFNSGGGGWYAMERTTSFIRVWYWSRYDPSVPSDIGGASLNTDAWGTPTAFFPNTECDIESHFGENNIIINLTLCGDWAGTAFDSNGCPGDCATYVNENPAAFTDAYWQFNSIRVYE